MEHNTFERAESCFAGRVSRYTANGTLLSTVLYYLGSRISNEMTGTEKAKLAACLGSLLDAGMKEGDRVARGQVALADQQTIEARARQLAKAKLAWLHDNFHEADGL